MTERERARQLANYLVLVAQKLQAEAHLEDKGGFQHDDFWDQEDRLVRKMGPTESALGGFFWSLFDSLSFGEVPKFLDDQVIPVSFQGKPRSPKWKSLRAAYLERFPKCQACNGTYSVTPHHIWPVHVKPELELEESNLISLCENPTMNCHLYLGHLGNWTRWNLEVKEHARIYREAKEKFQCW